MKRSMAWGGVALTVLAAVTACSSSHDGEFSGAGPGSGGAASGGTGSGAAASSGGSDASGGGGNASGGAATTGGSAAASGGSSGAPCSGASCGAPNPGALPTGSACTERKDCASGRCEPKTGTEEVVCLGACFADGAPCERALDFCSTGCHDGKCGGLCTVEGDDCGSDAECCSNICQGGRCQVDRVNSDCRPTGEDCTSGNSRGCCHECDKATKRCGFGDDTCFAQGVACTQDSQCCRGACTAGVCTTPCSENGAACGSGAECCSTECSPAGACVPRLTPPPGVGTVPDAGGAPVCKPTRDRCVTSAECCTGECFGGFCEVPIR